jgi:hypothetical protein
MRVINISVGGISVILISLGGTPVICRYYYYVKLALVTNSPLQSSPSCLRRLGIDRRLFSFLF